MGSDRKSKRTSPFQREEEDKRSKRQRTVEDEEKKERKREKKEPREDKKSRKHSKEKSDKKGKSKDKHRNKHRKGDAHTEFLQLSKDDYFAKNNEFAAWLKEEKNVFFSDLLSESAHELFTDFVKAWNKGKLDSHYYEGIASGPRTSHNWKIKK
ncbi:style cell-cycle inhibitor 1-B [Vigna angularis]|uniref:style cell-cycle inhibitor 1-B n=1 Tax=Phaseolus angularis TaxID=3914 RepID=UPI000809D6D1|nr:style cell-cycle inhibitor 1-B [Vigna angularis]